MILMVAGCGVLTGDPGVRLTSNGCEWVQGIYFSDGTIEEMQSLENWAVIEKKIGDHNELVETFCK